MPLKPDRSYVLWITVGALILLALVLAVLHFYNERDPAAQLAFKARRVALVARMRLGLASASEAEKSAIMATSDRDSLTFADQARSAVASVETARAELVGLLRPAGDRNELDLLAQFARDFAEFARNEKELLELAGRGTNLKAYGLAYGPSAEALKEMDDALARVAAESAKSGGADALKAMQLADDARIGAVRIQASLPPHIAEESDRRMDEMEAQMAKEDGRVRADMESLGALVKAGGRADVETAVAGYARFSELRAQIIKLSRENTNVRSLAISLNQQRKVMFLCQGDLAALEQAIQQEPVAGMAYGPSVYPR